MNQKPKPKSKVKTGVSASADVTKAPKQAPSKYLRSDVGKCSACGEDHTRVLFILRENWEKKTYPYAATCPISGEEILLKES